MTQNSLHFPVDMASFPVMDILSETHPVEAREPELPPPGTPLHVTAAPGVLEQDHVVVRESDDTDESYQSRCDLLASLLDYARNG